MKVYPVIHIQNNEQIRRESEKCQKAGVDGVFYIGLCSPKAAIIGKRDFGLWVGVNLGLGDGIFDDLVEYGIDGLWTDCSYVSDNNTLHTATAFHNQRIASGWNGEYHGGVAFKYQSQPRSVALAAQRALPFMDVVCTTGSGTGSAPGVSKIAEMKAAIGDNKLSIASGITPQNALSFKPYAYAVLTATGISDDFHTLNSNSLAELVKIARG